MNDWYPSVRYAALGCGVQRRWRNSQKFKSIDRGTGMRARHASPLRFGGLENPPSVIVADWSGMNCNAVPLQSPVSQSAHWERLGKKKNPNGVPHRFQRSLRHWRPCLSVSSVFSVVIYFMDVSQVQDAGPWERFLKAFKVFFISMATVMGPTPPGTGVMADTTLTASAKSTSPTRR